MQIALSRAVNHHRTRLDVPDQILLRTSWKRGNDDIGDREKMPFIFGARLRMHNHSGGADAHEHVLQGNSDTAGTIEDDGHRSLLACVLRKQALDGVVAM